MTGLLETVEYARLKEIRLLPDINSWAEVETFLVEEEEARAAEEMLAPQRAEDLNAAPDTIPTDEAMAHLTYQASVASIAQKFEWPGSTRHV